MIVNSILAGLYEENCYLLLDEDKNEICIIDPGGNSKKIIRAIKSIGGVPKLILLTHGHADHVDAVEELSSLYNIPFYLSKKDEEYMMKNTEIFGKLRKADKYLKENDEINFAGKKIKVIETPGHTKGSVSFLIDNMLFTGDTLFQGSVGRTDFEGGSYEEIVKSIKNKLFKLSDDIDVYPGHGPKTNLGYEKAMNPYID
ncbi:MBL fold metallo-hydrolase [Clostridium sp. BJN0001]|uniref:MBL fold metallo-hydrolase n=1 Tax=Clostridium sp. BJN0001 TaxID=2930219 RepID=UPI001FCFD9FC|nr:MBL fold metallo-hydrolase [Clostridium sp. BJN0001]